jgi:hypothetical protein
LIGVNNYHPFVPQIASVLLLREGGGHGRSDNSGNHNFIAKLSLGFCDRVAFVCCFNSCITQCVQLRAPCFLTDSGIWFIPTSFFSLSRESPLKCIFVFVFSTLLWSGRALATGHRHVSIEDVNAAYHIVG